MLGTNAIAKPLVDGYRVHSIFATIQGEGPYAGIPALFVRFSECNLRCVWCFGIKPGRRIPRVITASGSNKQLPAVRVGDKLLTFNQEQELVETVVTCAHTREVDQWLEIRIAGTWYFVTEEHPFFTTRGLVTAGNLVVGDMVLHAKPTDKLSWIHLGEKNPIHMPGVIERRIENTDYAAMGKKLSATRKALFREGKLTSSFQNPTVEARQAISTRQQGSNNSNWKGGPINYERAKRQMRGLFLPCERCKEVTKLEIHHIDRDPNNDSVDNFERICHRCHSQEHQRGFNFWASPRKDGKVLAKNGMEVQEVKKVNRKDFPMSLRPRPLPVYNLTCSPHNSYLIDWMWVHNCDTEFEGGKTYHLLQELVAEIEQQTKDHNLSLVVLTGGEPLLQDVGSLIQESDMGLHFQIETAGSVCPPGLAQRLASNKAAGRWKIVCSPKTPKVHPVVAKLTDDWKYIIQAGDLSEHDGLPMRSTQLPGKTGLAVAPCRPPAGTPREHVWLQPCDDENLKENMAAAVQSTMKYGYRLSLQLHKIVGLP